MHFRHNAFSREMSQKSTVFPCNQTIPRNKLGSSYTGTELDFLHINLLYCGGMVAKNALFRISHFPTFVEDRHLLHIIFITHNKQHDYVYTCKCMYSKIIHYVSGYPSNLILLTTITHKTYIRNPQHPQKYKSTRGLEIIHMYCNTCRFSYRFNVIIICSREN